MLSKIICILLLIMTEMAYSQPIQLHREVSFGDRIRHCQSPKAHYSSRGFSRSAPANISLSRKLPEINSVFIRGGINIQLIGSSENRIKLKKFYPGLSVKVCQRGIYISYERSINSDQNVRPCLKLYISRFNHLAVQGDSIVTGYGLNTACGLAITNCGNGSICLHGPLRIFRIENSGNGVLCFKGVNSEHLHVLATRRSVIRLSGAVHLLLIRAFQQATVDTRFMTSEDALVEAADDTLVTVRTYGSLRAFANGTSNIYYYTKPAELLRHNVRSGNVLQMGNWP